jgi:glycosyltransferase involved in cell wall biosynthesis
VPYKRFDLLIDLANRTGIRLKIAGKGSELARLKAAAGPNVELLGFTPDVALPSLYGCATALLFPQMEDAGIVPMEAQACGTPVIAFGQGGIVDVVKPGVTGILTDGQTVDSFEAAVKQFQSKAWNHGAIRDHARQFHEDAFKLRLRSEVEKAYAEFAPKL